MKFGIMLLLIGRLAFGYAWTTPTDVAPAPDAAEPITVAPVEVVVPEEIPVAPAEVIVPEVIPVPPTPVIPVAIPPQPSACTVYNPQDKLLPFTDYLNRPVGSEFIEKTITLKIFTSANDLNRTFLTNFLNQWKNAISKLKLGQLLKGKKPTLPQLFIEIDATKEIAKAFKLGWEIAEKQRQQGISDALSGKPLLTGLYNNGGLVYNIVQKQANKQFAMIAPARVSKEVWEEVRKELKKQGDEMSAELAKNLDRSQFKIDFVWKSDVEQNYLYYLTAPEPQSYASLVLPNGYIYGTWQGNQNLDASQIASTYGSVDQNVSTITRDSDCDGVADFKDFCLNTPVGEAVDAEGARSGCGASETLTSLATSTFYHRESNSNLELIVFPFMPNVGRGETYNYVIIGTEAYSVYVNNGKLAYWKADTQTYVPLSQAQSLDMARLCIRRLQLGVFSASAETIQGYLATFQAALGSARGNDATDLNEAINLIRNYMGN